MRSEVLARRSHRERTDLREAHQPRPWRCSPRDAIFCTHHGDCTCLALRRATNCPLHGDATDHPHVEAIRGAA